MQKGRSRRRDIGMSRYVAWHSNAERNVSDQVYEVNFAFLAFFCGKQFEKTVSVLLI
jgi:hypothetical protein